MENKEKDQEIMEEVEIPQEDKEKAPEEELQDVSQFEEHIRGLEAQGKALQEQYPDFDLARELSNPVFLQLTAPGTGISVEDAYYAMHRKEIQKLEAQKVARQVVQAIQSRGRRPMEAGTSGQAPSLTPFRYGHATKEEREAFKKQLRRAWGRGETVYPER